MMRKRGSQVGFVISFIIFVVFVFFLFVIVRPALNTSNSNNLPVNLVGNIANAASSNLTTISISINKNIPNCALLDSFFSNTGAGKNLIAKNNEDNNLPLETSSGGSGLYITKNSSDTFIRIYDSNEFAAISNGTLSGCQEINESSDGYSVGLIKTDEEVFVSKIISLMGNYTKDYDSLKNMLGVPSTNDFGFSFEYSNGTTISTAGPDANVNVYAYEIPVQYVSQSGNIESGFLNARTW